MPTPGQPPSAITLSPPQVDQPIALTGNYRFNSFDRQYIDSQIRGTQALLLDYLTRASLTYQPGGVASGTVYTSWAPLVAAASLVRGQCTVFFDGTYGSVTVPTGTWTFTSAETIFQGGYDQEPQVTFAASCRLVGVTQFVNMSITTTAGVPLISVPNGQALYMFINGCNLLCANTAPFIQASGSGTAFEVQCTDSTDAGDTTNAAFATAGGGTGIVNLTDGSGLEANSLSGTITVNIFDTSCTNASGTAATLITFATDLGYVDTSGNWATSAPTNIQDAVQRLAAAVKGLLGHTIP